MQNRTETDQPLIQRIESLERTNRRMKLAAGACALALVAAVALGFRPFPDPTPRIDTEELHARTVYADAFVVRNAKGEVRIDRKGLLITAPGIPTGNRTNITEYENRIEIGMDEDWLQQNALGPTPRVAVGRWGKDTGDNQVTRVTNVSPEGLHSGEWHTNNPDHTGRTDRDLIDSLKSHK